MIGAPPPPDVIREQQFQRFLGLARLGPAWSEYWKHELRELQRWDDSNYKYGWYRGLFRRIAEATKEDQASNG
jgi:hypothetical protein